MSINEDNEEYYRFTGPSRLDKELHTIEGLLRGISIDGVVTDHEIAAVRNWIAINAEFQNQHPFNEIIPALNDALADSALDDEEIADVLWLCESLTKDHRYFDAATADMQRLQAITAGIIADKVISKEELAGLAEWMLEHEYLKGCWPYDEIESVVTHVLQDGKVTSQEQETLKAFFAEFLKTRSHKAVDIPDNWGKSDIKGICSLDPQIYFSGHIFCFTGKSERASKLELHSMVEKRGGIITKTLVKTTNYLIIGADGNQCWAFACYGRKVEKAAKFREQGSNIIIVHEFDFWDAIEDNSEKI